jgi:hypothetical protein
MLDILEQAEKFLPVLLSQPTLWQGLYVDYHHPYVARLWTQWGENRISLHKIYHCQRKEALFHSHPWPQAAKILQGGYEMGVGYSQDPKSEPPLATRLFIKAGSAYEMTDPNGWHYVRPIHEPSFSIMVTGKPWPTNEIAHEKPNLRPLTSKEKAELLTLFKTFYR